MPRRIDGNCSEWVPPEKIVIAGKFDGPNLPDEMSTTIILQESSCRAVLTLIHKGMPGMTLVEMYHPCRHECLAKAAMRGEPEIADGS